MLNTCRSRERLMKLGKKKREGRNAFVVAM